MYHSYNAHVVTRIHANLINKLLAGEITPNTGLHQLHMFELDEEYYTEMRIRDAMEGTIAEVYEPTHRTSLFNNMNPQIGA